MRDLFAPISEFELPGGYGVILADPPWHFRLYSEAGEEKSAQAQYKTMPFEDLAQMPVRALANASGCALIMWCTAPILPVAIDLLKAWGFAYSSAGAWAKQSSTGAGWSFGTGYRYRSAAEFWLLGTLGEPRQRVRNVRNLIVAPVREHSRKPDAMHETIERQWEGPYCELFARQRRENWDSWGNEVDKFQNGENP